MSQALSNANIQLVSIINKGKSKEKKRVREAMN